jgi:hypothetical protein
LIWLVLFFYSAKNIHFDKDLADFNDRIQAVGRFPPRAYPHPAGLRCGFHEPVRRLHIIGGGSQNTLLNELTAQATGLKVTTGDVEATAVGNVMAQMGCAL